MLRKFALLTLVLALSLAITIPAFAAAPDFSAGIYADGQVFGTKGNADLPAPNENNRQSFDPLIKFTNGAEGQLPVAEAAPGNPAYNGGRWIEYKATWDADAAHVLLTSYAEVLEQVELGNLSLTETGNYFQCPLLPVK
jgi:hypothetical protein